MNIGNVQEYKIHIGEEKYTFRLDFKALIKFNNRYENALEIFNNFLMEKNEHECIIKILSCACVEKDFTEEELVSILSFDFPTMKLLDLIGLNIIKGSIMLDSKNSGGTQGKN